MEKNRLELEYLLRTSDHILYNCISTPDGMEEWFADKINIRGEVYTFIWDNSEEDARLVSKKVNSKIKWQWLEDEEDGLDTYFELKYEIDPMTKMVVLTVTDFAEPDETEESQRFWENQIGELKRTLGA